MDTSRQELESLRQYIEEQCGILLGEEKNYLLESRLAALLFREKCADFGAFLARVRADTNGRLRDEIIDAITTNETLWFRDPSVWRLLREDLLPRFIGDLQGHPLARVRIWSAACSTGQEPYSLAMLIDELLAAAPGGVTPAQFEIVGTDISSSALLVAQAGRYNRIAIARGLGDAQRARYFTEQKNTWQLADPIRQRVGFRRLNLQRDFSELGMFDLVLCRNVAIYFSDAVKKELFARVSRALQGRKLFILGATETLLGYSKAYDVLDEKNVIYYRVKPSGGAK